MSPTVRLVRTVHFSAGHTYKRGDRSEEENKKLFGSLYSPAGFGHNFKLEAHYEGPIDPDTGMTENLAVIDGWMKSVTALMDHRYLNRDLPYFRTTPPTAENIARFSFEEIHKRMTGTAVRLIKVRIYEGDRLWADVFAPGLTQAERDF